jgi:hypothetical protein
MILTLIILAWLTYLFVKGFLNGCDGVSYIAGGAVVTLVLLLIVLCVRLDAASFHQKGIALQETITEQRKYGDTTMFERASITRDIIDYNVELQQDQFYANNVWTSWFYPDYIKDLKPIK